MFKLFNIIISSYYLYKCIKFNIEDETYINNMIYYIDNSGGFFIKVVQSLIPRLEYSTTINEKIKNKIIKYYDNCNPHDFSYTKNIYKKEHGNELDEDYEIIKLIGSGSIAQVYKIRCKKTNNKYVLKVTHPNLTIDYYSFYIFYKLISKIFNLSKLLPINDMDKCIKQLYSQTDLINEVNNMCILSSCTPNNLYILPKVIKFSKNTLVMTYHKKSNYKDLTIFKKNMIWLKLLLFALGTGDLVHLSHCDLHTGNYSYENEKVIIYDMGFCANFIRSEFDLIFSIILNQDKKQSIYNFIKYFNDKPYNLKHRIKNIEQIKDSFKNLNSKNIIEIVSTVMKCIIKHKLLIPISVYNLLLVGNYFESNADIIGIGNDSETIHDKILIGFNDIINSYKIFPNMETKIKSYLKNCKKNIDKSTIDMTKLKVKII